MSNDGSRKPSRRSTAHEAEVDHRRRGAGMDFSGECAGWRLFSIGALAGLLVSATACKPAAAAPHSRKDGSPGPSADGATAAHETSHGPSVEPTDEDRAVAKPVEAALCRKGGCCVTGGWRLG